MHGILQVAILFTLLFYGGALFGIEYDSEAPFYPNATWLSDHPNSDYVEGAPTPKVQMYTIIYNVFITMTLFNIINARKLGERQFNVFEGFFNNWLFIAIFVAMWVVQFITI